MIVVMLSSSGASWTFYATQGDKVFLVETKTPHRGKEAEAVAHMVRECRWMFGDRRIVYMNRDDEWMEVLHDGTGRVRTFEKYDGPVPLEEETFDE